MIAPVLVLFTLVQAPLPQASPTPPLSSFYWFDLDGDGDQDALAIEPGGSVRLLRNQGAGSFADDTLAAGLAAVAGAKSALIGALVHGSGHGSSLEGSKCPSVMLS